MHFCTYSVILCCLNEFEIFRSFSPETFHILPLGIVLFLFGMGINIHSDNLLRQLRKPGELTYKIPQGNWFLSLPKIMHDV